MIKTASFGDVTQVEMSVSLFGRQVFPINSYIVQNLLIDTGAAMLSGEFLKAINRSAISTVVNTHAHPDHIGSNYAFPFVLTHPLAFERVRSPRLEMRLQRLLYGLPRPSTPREVPASIQTKDYTFRVLHTPGHTSDHISLFEPVQKWAFTGDLLLWGETREVYIDVNIHAAMNSLSALSALDIDTLFPGHGPPFRTPKEAIRTQLETLKEFGKRIQELHDKGMSPEDIRTTLFGKERMFTYLTGGKFSALNLVKSYLVD